MPHRKHLANLLRKLRDNHGLSQEALAEKAGLHRTYISQLEREMKSPTLDVMVALASAFGMTLKEFLSHFSRGLAV